MLLLLNLISVTAAVLWALGSRRRERRSALVLRVSSMLLCATGMAVAMVGLIDGFANFFGLAFFEASFGVALFSQLFVLVRGRSPQVNWGRLIARMPRRFAYHSRLAAVLVGLGGFVLLQLLIFAITRLLPDN